MQVLKAEINKTFISGPNNILTDHQGRNKTLEGSYLVSYESNTFLNVKQYKEGFTALSLANEKFDAQWMKDSGRNLAVVNPEAPFIAPEQFNEAASKDRRRYKKKVLNIWRNLIPDGEDLAISNGSHSIESKISRDIPRICREKSREEYYIPFAYNYNSQAVGGNYIHTWEAGTPKQVQDQRSSIKENPIKEFFTGGCLFGVPLYGIDQFGNEHSLTNPYHKIPASSIIQSIHSPHTIHPDEILTRESLANIIHLIKALGNEETTLKYHLPFPNYIIYGINWFLNGNMTKSSLASYIRILRARVNSQKSYLNSIACNFGIKINACSSLDSLGLDKIEPDNIIEQLLSKLSIKAEIKDGMSAKQLDPVKSKIYFGILAEMKNQQDENGDAWRHIDSKIEECVISTVGHDLLSLNYLDYSANLSVSVNKHGDREAASILPSHESPVNHLYKKVFAEKFGAVCCFQWLAPLQIHDSSLGMRAFHLSKFIEDINELLKLGLLKKSFLLNAAAALDSGNMREVVSKKVNEIMVIHEQSIKLRSQKEKLLLQEKNQGILNIDVSIFNN